VSARFKFIDNAEVEFHRLWSIRISLFVGALTGLCGVTSAFTGVFNPWMLLSISVVANVALIPLSRLVQQDDTK
jgi:hypothetical protein